MEHHIEYFIGPNIKEFMADIEGLIGMFCGTGRVEYEQLVQTVGSFCFL